MAGRSPATVELSPGPREAVACRGVGSWGQRLPGSQVSWLMRGSFQGDNVPFQWGVRPHRKGCVAGGQPSQGYERHACQDAHRGARHCGRSSHGVHGFWLGQELSKHELQRREDLWGPLTLGSPMCLFRWDPDLPQPCPGPPSTKVLGPDHSIPRSGGARGRPRTLAAPGGGRGHAQRAGE